MTNLKPFIIAMTKICFFIFKTRKNRNEFIERSKVNEKAFKEKNFIKNINKILKSINKT